MTNLIVLPSTPKEVLDFSTLSCHDSCPRKAFYQYILDRSPVGHNFPISFGVGYHTFREELENQYNSNQFDIHSDSDMDLMFELAWMAGSSGYMDPDPMHKKAWMTTHRLRQTCLEGLRVFRAEKLKGDIKILQVECSFDLELPVKVPCSVCAGEGWIDAMADCPRCLGHGDITPRYGGRFDQIIEWKNSLWVRDFKTLSRRPAASNYEPHNQFSGYVWAASMLSGRPVQGVWVETIYNTKTIGPEIKPFLTTRTDFHISQWIESITDSIRDYNRHVIEDMWPMRTSACNDWGGCYFRGACTQDGWPQIEEWLIDETIASTWDFTNPRKEKGNAI